MFVNTDFRIVLAGQVIMSCGQPFMLAAPAKVAALWFGDNERAIATTLGSLAGPIGAVTGFLLPLSMINDDDVPENIGQSKSESKFLTYVLVQNIIITVLSLPIIFLIRDNPPSPPSSSAEKVLKNSKKKKAGQCANI